MQLPTDAALPCACGLSDCPGEIAAFADRAKVAVLIREEDASALIWLEPGAEVAALIAQLQQAETAIATADAAARAAHQLPAAPDGR